MDLDDDGPNLPDAGEAAMRPARALLGWMTDAQARLTLASNQAGTELPQAAVELIESTRRRAQARDPFSLRLDAVAEIPAELESHVAAMNANAGAAAYFAEGWTPQLVDLRYVCAFQPTVFIDTADRRVAQISADDLAGIAELTLPSTWQSDLRVQFDQTRQAYLIASANPNLKIVGNFAGPLPGVPGNAPAVGFFVTIPPSYVQVARYQGRLYLRDGYHRALGLMRAGIHQVPAFVRELTAISDLVPVPAGMLPQEEFLGPRPPTLADFSNDDVAVDVMVPRSQRLVVVSALEMSLLG